jgi:nitrogenase molybdenum-iron protein alpha/beta subunit
MSEQDQNINNEIVMPYLTGVYLATNALRDAYLIVDGPNCIFYRTAQIQGNHDWHSSLVKSELETSSMHRVLDTDCTPERAAIGDHGQLVTRLEQLSEIEDCSAILLSSMSYVSITGRQYDKIIKQHADKINKPIITIDSGSLKGDWLYGYAESLQALAKNIELSKDAVLDQNQVAIVGYLMDRNEADHQANLKELERLLSGLSLELSCCWLSGGSYNELAEVSQAKTILSFPYGKKAAQTLAERTGAKLVECDLPLGLKGTSEFLRQVGAATGRKEEAENVIDLELGQTVPKLEWILPHSFLNKGIVLLGCDPYLAQALAGMLTELGSNIELNACFSDLRQLPNHQELGRQLDQLIRSDQVSLVIGNSRALKHLSMQSNSVPTIELGFPSYHYHALLDCPFMGYRGVLKQVERIINALSQGNYNQCKR